MNTKSIAGSVALIALLGAGGLILSGRRSAQMPMMEAAAKETTRLQESAKPVPKTMPDLPPKVANNPIRPAFPALPAQIQPPSMPADLDASANVPAPVAPKAKRVKPPIQDPVAREALAWVGVDSTAEDYWYSAINNSALGAEERKDLIEDLNEDGLSDPKHPTLADLSVIMNRINLIEEVGPDAMDQVNADAFAEAYKDLVNLANLVAGQGEPVR